MTAAPFATAADLTGLSDDALDGMVYQITRALMHRPCRDFALNSAVEIEGGLARGVVRLRMHGRAWRMETIEAAMVAIHLRLTPDLRGRDLFADGLCAASREAEQKVDSLRRYGVAVAVTEGAV